MELRHAFGTSSQEWAASLLIANQENVANLKQPGDKIMKEKGRV